MDVLVWTLTVGAFAVGLAGVVLPFLPGQGLILAAALVHKWLLPQVLSWWTLAFMVLAFFVGAVLDWAAGAAGVKWFGGTKWGMGGALVGGLVGLFFGLPGLLVGPLVGAVLAEAVFARRSLTQSSKAGIGVAAGMAVSTLGKLGLALAMIAAFFVDAFVF